MDYIFSFLRLAFVCLLGAGSLLAQPSTIVNEATKADGFNTLSAAIEAAGLTDDLNGDGPFTVFAPTDKAFASLPEGLLDALLRPENENSLRKILTHHLVNSRLKAADVLNGIKSEGTLTANSLEGSALSISEEEEQLFVEDGRGRKARIKSTDLKASNGLIHVIDRVLLPGSVNVARLLTGIDGAREVATVPPPPPAPPMTAPKPEVKPVPVETVKIAKATPPPPPPTPSPFGQTGHLESDRLSTLISVLEATDLFATFNSGGQFTTFAPVNEAFGKLPAGSLNDLRMLEHDGQMSNILRYHLIMAPISASALTAALEKGNGFYQMTSMNGQTIIAILKSGKIQLMDSYGNTANVIQTDVPAGKGVMHLIDGVLLPR